MNILIEILLAYLLGVIIMSFLIRCTNAKEKSKCTCMTPGMSLLSWIGVILYIGFSLQESAEDGFIAKVFKYTDKE